MFDQKHIGRADNSAMTAAGAGSRVPGLDGARGLACLAVILGHVMVHFTPDVIATTHLDMLLGHGVTFFFALSAFLLYMPYVKRLCTGRRMPEARTYLRRRVLRIFPAYLVIFLLANFVLRAVYVQNPFSVGWSNGDQGTGMITDPGLLLANLTLTQTLFPATLQTGVNTSWALTVEWAFYLSLPVIGLVVFALAKTSPRPLGAATVPAVILFAVGVTTNVIVEVLQAAYYPDSILAGYWGSNWTAVLSRSFLYFANVFAIGMLAAVVYVALANGKLKSVPTFRLQWILASCIPLGVIGGVAVIIFDPHYFEALVGVVSGAVILLITAPIARGEHSVFASIMEWGPIRYFGLISLSAYLWHYPVIILVGRLHLAIPDAPVGSIVAFAIVCGATIALASATYWCVEEPAKRFRG